MEQNLQLRLLSVKSVCYAVSSYNCLTFTMNWHGNMLKQKKPKFPVLSPDHGQICTYLNDWAVMLTGQFQHIPTVCNCFTSFPRNYLGWYVFLLLRSAQLLIHVCYWPPGGNILPPLYKLEKKNNKNISWVRWTFFVVLNSEYQTKVFTH